MAFLIEIVRLGLSNLLLHKLRSLLTSLGIILGVAAVILMVAIGEGNKRAALREIQALGATNIILRSAKPAEKEEVGSEVRAFTAKYGLTRADVRRLEAFIPHASFIVPLKAVGDELLYQDKKVVSQAFGTFPELLDVANLRVGRGRYLTDVDVRTHAPVAVIGAEVAEKFFQLRDPIGAKFRIGEQIVEVVGVLQPVGLAGGRGSALVGRDLNLDVHIPYSTAEAQFGDRFSRRVAGTFSDEEVQVSEVYVMSATTESVLRDAAMARQIVAVTHAEEGDVEVIVPYELLETAKKTAMMWNVVLTFIAAISLLVGGIGIMNIMLASVTERTREIGIRRALGATKRHIVSQFLVETGSLSALGGLLGIALGVNASLGLERLLNLRSMRGLIESDFTFETHVTAWSIIASFIVAAFVGLVFGLYPAVVASRQDPIVALRHD